MTHAVTKLLRYTDCVGTATVDQAGADLARILRNAWDERDLAGARACLDLLADTLEIEGAPASATHLRRARAGVFTFLTHPDAGRLVAGHKGRPASAPACSNASCAR